MSYVAINQRLGTAQIIQGNALALPLPDSSVDLICTSPPYFGLRSYQDAGVHYGGQIGSEATPAKFLDALLAATREMVRVLKPTGSIFVNLGDKYAGNHGTDRTRFDSKTITGAAWRSVLPAPKTSDGARPKSLLGIPWRYAIACIDQLGLILRAEIIWAKPNGLPESVTDRVRRSHEQWFHFTKSPRYFSAVDEIRETYAPSSLVPNKVGQNAMRGRAQMPDRMDETGYTPGWAPSPLGKLPGSVWTIPTQPLTVPPELGVDHFAAYPMEWPRRIIQGWTPNGICCVCGEGRRPIADNGRDRKDPSPKLSAFANSRERDERGVFTDMGRESSMPPDVHREYQVKFSNTTTITGYVCGCPTPDAPTTPARVVDPFGGTGTTALVAKALGRIGITIDLSADYCRLAEWRCNDPGQLAAALEIEKTELIPDGQLSLFESA